MPTLTNVTSTVRSLITIRTRENLSMEEDPLRFASSNEQSFLCLTQIRLDRCSFNSRVIINFQNSAVATLCSQPTHPWKKISWGPVLVIKVICVQLRHPFDRYSFNSRITINYKNSGVLLFSPYTMQSENIFVEKD